MIIGIPWGEIVWILFLFFFILSNRFTHDTVFVTQCWEGIIPYNVAPMCSPEGCHDLIHFTYVCFDHPVDRVSTFLPEQQSG